MGFFGKIFSAGLAMNRLAKTFDECFNALRRYNYSYDEDELYRSMWLFVFGVQGSIEKWNWNPFTTSIYIPNHIELGHITINQAIMLFMGNITQNAQICGIDGEILYMIDNDEAFNRHSYLVSIDLKNKLQP